MTGTGAKRNVCPGSCVTTGATFPVAPVESAPMILIFICTPCSSKWPYGPYAWINLILIYLKYFFNKSWKIILDNESVESTEEDDAV